MVMLLIVVVNVFRQSYVRGGACGASVLINVEVR